ncbi:MAG: nucleotidyltransferase domain-containing protein [Actinomycetota bacterium]|nr:nucleotidyltransferase domain-containing protein [Actinomycetota bacterium]
MSVVTQPSRSLRNLIDAHRGEFDAVMHRYGAKNLRLFGSVARGDATQDSDIDLLVDLDPADANILFRAGELNDEFRRILRRNVDVFSPGLLKGEVSAAAVADAMAL